MLLISEALTTILDLNFNIPYIPAAGLITQCFKYNPVDVVVLIRLDFLLTNPSNSKCITASIPNENRNKSLVLFLIKCLGSMSVQY